MKENEELALDLDEVFDMEAIKGLTDLFLEETSSHNGILEATLYDHDGFPIPVIDLNDNIYHSKTVHLDSNGRDQEINPYVFDEFIFTAYDFLVTTRNSGYTAKLVMKLYPKNDKSFSAPVRILEWKAKHGILSSWKHA